MAAPHLVAEALQPLHPDDDDDDEGDYEGDGQRGAGHFRDGRSGAAYESDDGYEDDEALLLSGGSGARGHGQPARRRGRHEAWQRQARRAAIARSGGGDGERRGLLTPDAYVPSVEDARRRAGARRGDGDAWKGLMHLLGV